MFSPFGTLGLDQNTFIGWSNRLVEVGFARFYEAWSDYLPGYLYILWFLGWLKKTVAIPQVLLFKLPAIISDIATGLIIYLIVNKLKNKKWGLIASSFYLFNPAIIANSTLWGQADSLTALFSLLAVWLVNINPLVSSLALAFGTLVKPQVALAAPVVLFVMLRRKWKMDKIARYVLISLSFFILGFVPFAGGKSFILFILERITTTLGQYLYTSVNAFNFWGLFGFWRKDIVVSQLIGFAATAGISLFAARKLWKTKNARFFLASIVFSSGFMFFTRMHERHLLPVLAPLIVAFALNKNLWIPYVGFSFAYIANLYYSFVWITEGFVTVLPTPIIVILILLNLALLLLMLFEVVKKDKKTKFFSLFIKRLTQRLNCYQKKPKKRAKKLSTKTVRISLLAILLFSLVARIFWLSSPAHEYFDEVYHAFTARRMLHGDPKAWEWWNTPPEGFAYEWTHPPLAKLGMVLGMLVFGENPFGWRIPGALLGVGSVFLVYLIAKSLFKDELIGLLSSAVFALDGLPLVMSRIGMNDSYLLFFSLLAIYLFITNKAFLSALSFGLALSSKWSAIWMTPILLVSHFVLKKKLKLNYLWFFLLPPLVYLASYIPMFLTGHGFDIFVGVQKQMWWYHTRLDATHAYTSSWWSWPILVRPIYLYTSGYINNLVANIYAMGNPVVFWFGLISVFPSACFAFIERNKKLGFVVFSYFIFFASWAVSPRIMFLYHYLPSIPFLAIVSGFVLRRFSWLRIPLLLTALIVFIFFYPHWAGIRVSVPMDNLYYWFSSWR